MKISTKWTLWFVLIGVYVMTLGGVFFYNLFKWTFDEKLKMDVIDMVKNYAPTMRDGLLKNPGAVTFEEFSLMNDTLSKDQRVASIIYLNKTGIIRWHREARFIGMSWDQYIAQVPPLTDAIAQAIQFKKPVVRPVPKQSYYEIAIPLTVNNNIVGSLLLMVSKATSDVLVTSAMKKYVVGAIGVLFLLGIPFYFFFYHYIINPLESLSESIEGASFKSFELRFNAKNDEIGMVAESVNNLLQKVKKEIDTYNKKDIYFRELEERWWKTILKTIVPLNEYVIVVDEDNNVLYANFELKSVEGANTHLLDVVDSQQQNLLRFIGQAFDTPGEVVEGETIFKGQNLSVKVVHIGDTSELNRTLIHFYPKKVY
jgi:methyl-accepting chemotaxis protein